MNKIRAHFRKMSIHRTCIDPFQTHLQAICRSKSQTRILNNIENYQRLKLTRDSDKVQNVCIISQLNTFHIIYMAL
jgi:hypothetical protein